MTVVNVVRAIVTASKYASLLPMLLRRNCSKSTGSSDTHFDAVITTRKTSTTVITARKTFTTVATARTTRRESTSKIVLALMVRRSSVDRQQTVALIDQTMNDERYYVIAGGISGRPDFFLLFDICVFFTVWQRENSERSTKNKRN